MGVCVSQFVCVCVRIEAGPKTLARGASSDHICLGTSAAPPCIVRIERHRRTQTARRHALETRKELSVTRRLSDLNDYYLSQQL